MEEPQRSFTEQENIVFAATLLGRNTPRNQVEAGLIERGVGAITATQMVDKLIEQRDKARRSAAIRGMVIGGVLIIAGVYVGLTTQVADKASTIVVAVAAALYGLARVVQSALLLRK